MLYEIFVTQEVGLTPKITTRNACFSYLKPNFAIQELCCTVHLSATQEEVVQSVITHVVFMF